MAFEIKRFLRSNNLIMACHITGVYDVNRSLTLADDNYELVQSWAASIAAANLQGLIFHNNFSKAKCDKYENEHLAFIKIDYNPQFNPNVYRYFIYQNFLQQHINLIKSIFITDVSDVVLVKNPFTDPYFMENPNTIFCGDEPKILNNEWMVAHATNLRKKIPDYEAYENSFANQTLLNCGIIGSAAPLLYNFIQKLCAIHLQANYENKTAYTGDMGAFNYLARTQFNSLLRHGTPINTIFKEFENERKDCWFRHK